MTTAADDDQGAARPSRKLVAALAAFTVVFAAAGYVVVGTPSAWRLAPGAGDDVVAEVLDEQTEAMLRQLQQKLAANPGDAEGWAMLGRSMLVLGRHAEAAKAFEALRKLRPDDAQALVDLADAKAMLAGRNLKGEPEALIARALELQPNNLKALALAGTVAFDRGDWVAAVRHWENAVAAGDPASELAANLRNGIDEARRRGGLPPASGGAVAQAPGATPAPAAATPPAAAASAQVSGRVTLAATLRDKAASGDTLFVFARAAEGSRMPLALLRAKVSDLPLDFTLDDAMAMSEVARLSGAKQVIVGARVSKTGQAAPQPGDLQGFSAPVAVGARGVAVEIGEVVK